MVCGFLAASFCLLAAGCVRRELPADITIINNVEPESFKKAYALAKITRYADICNKNRTQSKFLLGWVNRTLKGLK